MKTRRTWDPGVEGETEALRSLLRDWRVPEPPHELEVALRQTFRRRVRRRRRATWLAIAAGLTLATLVSQREPTKRPRPSAETQSPRVSAAAPAVAEAPAPKAVVPDRAGGGRPVAVLPIRGPVGRRPSAAASVIVEPRQAELLAELGHRLQRIRQAPPAGPLPQVDVLAAHARPTPIPAAPAADVPEFRTHWETDESSWPLVHRSVPTGRR